MPKKKFGRCSSVFLVAASPNTLAASDLVPTEVEVAEASDGGIPKLNFVASEGSRYIPLGFAALASAVLSELNNKKKKI